MDKNASIHPIDVRTLKKGSYITPDQCVEILGIKRDDPNYNFKIWNLTDFIYAQSQLCGLNLSCSIEQDGIMIHTDSQASKYHIGRINKAMRSIGTEYSRLVTTVNTKNLTQHELDVHTAEVKLTAARILAMKKAKVTQIKNGEVQSQLE